MRGIRFQFWALSAAMTLVPLVRAQVGAGTNVIISSTAIAQVSPTEAGGNEYDIFEDTRNAERKANPRSMRFYIQPMFLPKRDTATDPASPILIEEDEISKDVIHDKFGGTGYKIGTVLKITLLTRTDTERGEAANAVATATGLPIVASQISSIPLTQVTLTVPDLEKASSCVLTNPVVPLSGGEPFIQFFFRCTDTITKAAGPKPSVAFFKAHLASFPATIAITYAAREADLASVNLDVNQVTSSDFMAQLSGKGDSVYVSRDDLRKLAVQASQNVHFSVKGRDLKPDEIRACLTPQMLSFPDVSIDRDKVTAEVLKQTFSTQDLSPTEVDKELSETLDKSSTEDHYVISMNANVDVLWGLAKGGGSGSADVLKKFMSEHGVKTEWDGKRWIAKGLDVKQVNTVTLANNISRSCSFQTYSNNTPLPDFKHPIFLK